MTYSAIRRDTASRLIQASTQTIYAALVTREAVIQWLPPQGAMMEIQRFEPWVGGQFQMVLIFATASGKSTANTDIVVGRFVDLVPQERIVQAFKFASTNPAFSALSGMMTMIWALQATADGTVVTVTAENGPPGIDQADHETGMRFSLAKLAAYVE